MSSFGAALQDQMCWDHKPSAGRDSCLLSSCPTFTITIAVVLIEQRGRECCRSSFIGSSVKVQWINSLLFEFGHSTLQRQVAHPEGRGQSWD